MTLAEFEELVRSYAAEIPPEFLQGIVEITVSPRILPHPNHADIFTLGECIALPSVSDSVDSVVSRVVLYHGSFAALAREDNAFDWAAEAWETLTHEIRHHVEWRAREDRLEAEDEAVYAALGDSTVIAVATSPDNAFHITDADGTDGEAPRGPATNGLLGGHGEKAANYSS